MAGIHIHDGERCVEESFGWSSGRRLNIAVFSDIHIPGDDLSKKNIQIRENFIQVLGHALTNRPDAFIITGDLGQHEGCVQSYRWIKEILDQSCVSYLIIPGNHDQGSLIETVFTDFRLCFGKLFYFVRFGCWSFIFLDSSPDSVSQEQLEWMDARLSLAAKDSLWALVMHHPPVTCGCTYMDSHYPLMNNQPLLDILDRHEQIKHVFCGHYHTAKNLAYNNRAMLHITPSTWFQIDEKETDFTISDPRIGYLSIVIDGCSLATSIIMLPPR